LHALCPTIAELVAAGYAVLQVVCGVMNTVEPGSERVFVAEVVVETNRIA
jgi:hypothetical protein